MVKSNSKCKNCNEYWKNYKYQCSYKCSKKGKEKIIPKNYKSKEIKKVLENNLGCFISHKNISVYSREILKFIKNET